MRDQKKVLRDYQQALIDAYYDRWMHDMLDPLYKAFQKWKQGDLKHNDLTELIHNVHQNKQKPIASLRKDEMKLSIASKWIVTFSLNG